MSAILDQLGLNKTFFYQLVIFAIFFLVVCPLYFKPFMRLLESRHKSTVADREAAERLMADADAKFEEYKRRLADERAEARNEYEAMLAQARKEEATLLSAAREEAKKITQEAADSATQQEQQLKQKLEADVEAIAKQISEKLVSRSLT